MRLVELEPEWVGVANGPAQAGVKFRCPCVPNCEGCVVIMFDKALDGSPVPSQLTWARAGDSFENLTLRPSIRTTHINTWHGFLTDGELRPT